MLKTNLLSKAASCDAVADRTLIPVPVPTMRDGAPIAATPVASSNEAPRRSVLRSLALAAFALVLSAGLALAPGAAFADEGEDLVPEASFGQAVAALTGTVINEQSAQELGAYTDHLEAVAQEAAHAARVDAVLAEAMTHQGAPYAYGGTTPRGFDCSGFTSYVFRTALGIELPRTAASQSGMGESVSMDSLLPGDLLFWGRGSGVYHVGIYVGDGSYIHAAGSGKGVRVQTMEYFHPTFAKRLL